MEQNPLYVKLPLKVFLQIEYCPPEWRRLNLYMIGEDDIIFYVGQSYVAFHRVWEHFYAGFKGRSLLGRCEMIMVSLTICTIVHTIGKD